MQKKQSVRLFERFWVIKESRHSKIISEESATSIVAPIVRTATTMIDQKMPVVVRANPQHITLVDYLEHMRYPQEDRLPEILESRRSHSTEPLRMASTVLPVSAVYMYQKYCECSKYVSTIFLVHAKSYSDEHCEHLIARRVAYGILNSQYL